MIVGVSPAIRRALVLAERYAWTRCRSPRRGDGDRQGTRGPLVDVNYCALPRDMVESLFFGHRRGALTGAVDSTIGHVERFDGGTPFLDELGSLGPNAQGKPCIRTPADSLLATISRKGGYARMGMLAGYLQQLPRSNGRLPLG